MTTKRNKSSAENYLENLAGPLTLVSLIESIRRSVKLGQKEKCQRC